MKNILGVQVLTSSILPNAVIDRQQKYDKIKYIKCDLSVKSFGHFLSRPCDWEPKQETFLVYRHYSKSVFYPYDYWQFGTRSQH